MTRLDLIPLLALAGCAFHAGAPPDHTIARAPGEPRACETPPAGKARGFRHAGSQIVASFGTPRHRGVDLIARQGDATQTLGGKVAYGAADADLEDEAISLFACDRGSWRPLGTTRSDGDGRFRLVLAGDQRLPVGMRDLYARVDGDGTGVRFLAYVARPDERLIAADVDGTLTASENAIVRGLLFGDDVAHRRFAPELFARSGHVVVYLTARGDQFTEITRHWLRRHGFPPGPLRLAPAAITRPGKKTVALKTRLLRALPVPVVAGFGNRGSDVEAYRNAGLPADRIFVKLPEFRSELARPLADGAAVGFTRYDELRDRFAR